MLRAAIAEQARLVAIGAKTEVGDRPDTSAGQALGDIAGQVKVRLAGALVGHEEGLTCRLLSEEAVDIVGANLIGPLRDRGADHRDDALAFGAKLLHGRDRGLGDAEKGAAPAGMRGSNAPRLRIAEQDWCAIGSERADGETWRAGDEGVGLGRLSFFGCYGDH